MTMSLLDLALSQTFDEEASVEVVANFLDDRTPGLQVIAQDKVKPEVPEPLFSRPRKELHETQPNGS